MVFESICKEDNEVDLKPCFQLNTGIDAWYSSLL